MTVIVDLASQRVRGGFFIFGDCAQRAFRWPQNNDGSYQFIGTFRDPTDSISRKHGTVRDALLDLIRNSNARVFVASLLIGDQEVIEELLRAAARLKGGVYVITALTPKALRQGLADHEVDDAPPEERKKNFERLTEGGIYVRGHEGCHAKFAVSDDSRALIGSANFVRNSLDWNNEAGLVVRDAVQVRQAARLFTELWFGGCTWEIPAGRVYTVAQRTATEPPSLPDLPGQVANRLVWTNGPDQTLLLKTIQDTIAAARNELTISSYSIVGMSENESLVFEPLRQAIERGVAVRLHIRQKNARPWEMAELVAAADMGVEIHGDTRNHAKAVISDRKVGVVFSANLDANHGLTNGVEVGMRLEDPVYVDHLCSYFDHVIETAETMFVRDPTLGQLNEFLAGRWRKKWPFRSEFELYGPKAGTFLEEAVNGVCLYEEHDDELWLYTARIRASLKVSPDGESARMKSIAESKPAEERMGEWLQSVRGPRAGSLPPRGFCPARLTWKDGQGMTP